MKILLALGSDPHATAISTALQADGWRVVTDADLGAATHWAAVGEFDAVLIAADLSAVPALRDLRSGDEALALLAIGPEQPFATKAQIFTAGADDVMTHPIAPAEIALRAAAVVRRRGGRGGELHFGDLTVVPGHYALVRGTLWRMSPQEWELLELLALRAGRTVTKEAMLARLYADRDESPDTKIIEVRICGLRGSLRALGLDPALISTIYGRGYALPKPFPTGAAPDIVSTVARQAFLGRTMNVAPERAA